MWSGASTTLDMLVKNGLFACVLGRRRRDAQRLRYIQGCEHSDVEMRERSSIQHSSKKRYSMVVKSIMGVEDCGARWTPNARLRPGQLWHTID